MYCRWIPDWQGLPQVARFSLTLITVTILKKPVYCYTRKQQSPVTINELENKWATSKSKKVKSEINEQF